MMVGLVAMAAASCAEEPMVQYNPEKTVAPVLEGPEAESFVLAEDKSKEVFGTFTFSEADFGVPTAVRYTLYADLKGNDFAYAKKIKSLDTPLEGAPSFAPEVSEINSIVLKFIKDRTAEGEELNPVADVEFRLTAEWMGEGNPTGVVLHSNVLSYNVTVFIVKSEDVDYSVYEKVWVIGNYCGWNFDNTQFLYNLEGDDVKYQGIIGFGGKAADGWKMSGVANWDDSCNWGCEDGVEYEAEAATTQLINDGGSKDIKHYSKNFYHISYNKTSLELSISLGFNEVGVIGLGGDWTEGVPMTFDAKKQLFYADVDVPSATEFKFWFDKSWDVYDLGGDMTALTKGGDNIAIDAGKYRIVLDLMNFDAPTARISEDEYGAADTPDDGEGDGEGEDEGTTTEGPTVAILCEDTGWEQTNLHGWNFGVTFDWPGLAADGTATLGGKQYCYWILDNVDVTNTDAGVIFNNGTVQTVDMKPGAIDGNKCFRVKLDDANAEGKLGWEELEVPSIRITYKNEENWGEVCIYGWGSTYAFGEWPGKPMTKEGDVWVYDIPVTHLGETQSLIFNNNNNGAQTVDLTGNVLNSDLTFDSSNAQIK